MPPNDHHSDVFDELDDVMGLVTAAEAVSEAVVGEIREAGLQIARATTATPSNHRRLQSLSNEKEWTVDLKSAQDDDSLRNNDIDGNEDEDEDEAQFSSSEEADDGRSNGDDVLTDSESSKESSSIKDNPHYFYADFEGSGDFSDIESAIDTIEHYARSISGLTFLSELGFEDLGDKEVLDIEEKVIKEYGLDFIQKFEESIGDDDEPNNSIDKSDEEKSGNKGDQTPRQSKDSSSLQLNTTATTTAEILDDIIDAELEGKEVEYDPTKRESIRRSRIRSFHKPFGIIRNRSQASSSRKKTEFEANKESKIQEPEDALTNRAAATMILDNNRNVGSTGAVIENQGSNKGDSNLASQITSSGHSHAETDKLVSSYSYVDTDEAPAENIIPQRREKISNFGNTTTPYNKSCERASHKNWYVQPAPINILKRIDRVNIHSVNKDPHLPVKVSDHGEKERTMQIASNLDRFESESQHQQQNLKLIHNPNGPLIRLSSFCSVKSASSIASSAYYDNTEVVYDPNAFIKPTFKNPNKKSDPSLLNHEEGSERKIDYHSGAKMKNHDSCCDLRTITTTLRKTRSHEDKKMKIQQLCNESNHRDASTPKSPWKIIDDAERQHRQSYPPSESEGVEMQLLFDCLKYAKHTKSHSMGSRPDKIRKKKNRFTRRFLDPERLFCGLIHPQPRINMCEKENAHNNSMETAATAATADEEDSSKLQVKVTDIISASSSDDPLILALLQETRTSPREHKKPFNIDYVTKRTPSRESFSIVEPNKNEDDHTMHARDKTRISVTSQIRKIDSDVATAETKPIVSCPVPILPEDQPDFGSDLVSSPVPELHEAKPKYGGDLVDLLQKISSYVDKIVEKNDYSLPLPSTGSVLENKKNGKEEGVEKSNLKTETSHEIKNTVVSGTKRAKRAKPPKGVMLDAIYVPTSMTPEKVESCKTTPKVDTNEERSIDLLSLFDSSISLSYSESSYTDLIDKSNSHPKTPPRSFVDDELSEDSSMIVESSVEHSITSTTSSKQQREEIQKPWDGENPVVYHMSSSPPLAKRSSRATQKRTVFKRTLERHSAPLKTGAKSPSDLGRKAKTMDENVDLCSVESLPYRVILNPRPEGSPEKRSAREDTTHPSQSTQCNFQTEMGKENAQNRSVFHEKMRSSQALPPKPTKPSYRERRRPPTPPTGIEAGFGQTDVVPATTEGTTQVNVEQHKKTSSRSNGLVVDEDGFIFDRNADLLEILENRSDAATFQPYESILKPAMQGQKPFFVAGSTKGTVSSTPGVNGRLARRSIGFQAMTGSDSHRRNPIDAENHSYSEPEPYWKTITSTGQVLVNGQDLHSRLHR